MSKTDIFFSYANEDKGRVARLVVALEAGGWSVFWDRRIPAGQTWRSHIGRALEQARCVVVAWSEHSIQSEWVIEEADDGRERGILVPAFLDPVRPPRGFRAIQAADLSGWSPEHPSPARSRASSPTSVRCSARRTQSRLRYRPSLRSPRSSMALANRMSRPPPCNKAQRWNRSVATTLPAGSRAAQWIRRTHPKRRCHRQASLLWSIPLRGARWK